MIPIFQYFMGEGFSINGNLSGSIFPQNVIYFMAGHYLENVIDRGALRGRRAAELILSGFLTILVSCFVTERAIDITGQYSEMFYNNLIFIPTVAIFYFFRYLFENNTNKISNGMARLLIVLGGTSFGIMLMEDVLRSKLQFIFGFLRPYCGDFLACVLWVLSTWGCGVIGILVIKRIPIFRKLL